jgi:hypothetical protein
MEVKQILWCFASALAEVQQSLHWLCKGLEVKLSQQFRHLGVVLHQLDGMLAAVEPLSTAARKAIWAP